MLILLFHPRPLGCSFNFLGRSFLVLVLLLPCDRSFFPYIVVAPSSSLDPPGRLLPLSTRATIASSEQSVLVFGKYYRRKYAMKELGRIVTNSEALVLSSSSPSCRHAAYSTPLTPISTSSRVLNIYYKYLYEIRSKSNRRSKDLFPATTSSKLQYLRNR
jgi:hypothetical protein